MAEATTGDLDLDLDLEADGAVASDLSGSKALVSIPDLKYYSRVSGPPSGFGSPSGSGAGVVFHPKRGSGPGRVFLVGFRGGSADAPPTLNPTRYHPYLPARTVASKKLNDYNQIS